MLSVLLSALLATTPPGPTACTEPLRPPPGPPPPTRVWTGAEVDSLESYWDRAVPFERFYAGVQARAALWERNYTEGEVPSELLSRARRAVAGTPLRMLAVTIDGCSDSVNTIPYLALLADGVPGLDLRLLTPALGRALMEARPTADGRAATPTLVLLDPDFQDVGCFVERPRPLKEWIAAQEASPSGSRRVYEGKMRWYAEDDGRATLREIVGLLEAAAAGTPVCEG